MTSPFKTSSDSFRTAIANIATFGDTDLLPFPFERSLFKDSPEDVLRLLLSIDQQFDRHLEWMPPRTETCLTALGAHAFRRGTQLDPVWNAYFLGLVLSVSDAIESSRLPKQKRLAFSHRVAPDEEKKTLFDMRFRWTDFLARTEEMAIAKERGYVVFCDVSNFFPRIDHSILATRLQRAGVEEEAIDRIRALLRIFTHGRSTGLPVGGPASRILSELLLDDADRCLVESRITFCRYTDDFRIFVGNQQEIRPALLRLSEALDKVELSLQRGKTRIITCKEHIRALEKDAAAQEKWELVRIPLGFNPYAEGHPYPDEVARYEKRLKKFDVVAMFEKELERGLVDKALVKHLVRSLIHLDDAERERSIRLLLKRFDSLYPVFSTLVVVLRRLLDHLTPELRDSLFQSIRKLVDSNSPITSVPAHEAFALRLLARDPSQEADKILKKIYAKTDSALARRDIVLALAQRGARPWLRQRLKGFPDAHPWERRAIIASRFYLGEFGKDWRDRMRRKFKPDEKLVDDWIAARWQAHPDTPLL